MKKLKLRSEICLFFIRPEPNRPSSIAVDHAAVQHRRLTRRSHLAILDEKVRKLINRVVNQMVDQGDRTPDIRITRAATIWATKKERLNEDSRIACGCIQCRIDRKNNLNKYLSARSLVALGDSFRHILTDTSRIL